MQGVELQVYILIMSTCISLCLHYSQLLVSPNPKGEGVSRQVAYIAICCLVEFEWLESDQLIVM